MSGPAGGRLGLTIVGAVIGGLLGATGGPIGLGFGVGLGASIGATAGSIAGTLIFPDKPIQQFQIIGSSLADAPVTFSEAGKSLSEFDGTNRHGLNVVWQSPVYVEVMDVESSSGGKGGGGGVESTTRIVRNFVDCLAIAGLCPIDPAGDLLQVFRQGTLIYDRKSGNGADNPLADRLEVTFLTGASDQLPPALIEQYEGVGNVPGYRYQIGVLFRHLEVTNAPIAVQGLQAVINSEPRTDEV